MKNQTQRKQRHQPGLTRAQARLTTRPQDDATSATSPRTTENGQRMPNDFLTTCLFPDMVLLEHAAA